MSRARWLLKQFTRKLWLRVTVMGLIGVTTAVAGILLGPFIPDAWTIKIGAQAIDKILNVLASSLLAVTVFSLSTMVAAYGAATTNVTPRATKLLMEDETSQNVLGTFIGAFLFSLVGIIALSTGLYGSQGRAILLVVTISMIVLIAATILRWIDYLARFGRLGETVQRVEEATWEAMKTRLEHPFLGGQPQFGKPPRDAWPVCSKKVGYVQHIDIAALEACSGNGEHDIFVMVLPGIFADPARPIAVVSGSRSDELEQEIAQAFTVDAERTFDQDPRFGLCVLAEIASRALSPAVNDPGTAIDVIGRGVRLLVEWARFNPPEAQDKTACPHVHVPEIRIGDMLDDVFAPIERDGAGMIEIQLRLQKAFIALLAADRNVFGADVRRHSANALEWAESALTLEHQRQAVRSMAARIDER